MRATVNGRERELPKSMSVRDLLEYLQAPLNGVAVARNDRVVRRSDLAKEVVEEGDRIEIIRAVAGG